MMLGRSGATRTRMQRAAGAAIVAAVALASCGRVEAPAGDEAAVQPSPTPAAVATAASTTPAPAPASEELTLTKCGLLTDNPLVGPEAVLRITNRSSQTVTYYARVGFFSKDGVTHYDTGHATVEGLLPGRSREDEASSLNKDLRKHGRNGFTCKVMDVLRV